jgi:hypothetical protein
MQIAVAWKLRDRNYENGDNEPGSRGILTSTVSPRRD